MRAIIESKSTCCYCGTGCGMLVQTDGDKVLGVRGDPAHPVNRGRLCSKGSNLHLTTGVSISQQVRALYPEMRSARDLPRQRCDWDQVLQHMAEKFSATIAQNGPDSVGFYISGQLLTEDYYVFNKLAKGLIGTNNIDSNSRLCMSSAVAAYKQNLGADAPPCCYEDIEQAGLIFIIGSNTAYAHPILYRRIEAARQANPDIKMIVVDPRLTDTARDADLFLQIQPGTDVALLNGMLHICCWEGWLDEAFIAAHTDGLSALKHMLRDYTPAMVAEICGIRVEDLLQAARWFANSRASLSLYCQGLNQSSDGTAKNSALINLHLACGQIGRAGAGPFSLTGQPNAMGGREVGGMANLLSGHRDMGNAAHRAEVAALWGVTDVPATPGKTAIEMFEAVRQGQIKILWIVCTNPAQSLPDQHLVREALDTAELVIVQEAYAHTATATYADILLPATTWPEKEGSSTNSERRISYIPALLPAPGECRHDWQIAVAFAHKLEQFWLQQDSALEQEEGALADASRPLPRQRERAGEREGANASASASTNERQSQSLFPYTTCEQIWNEHRDSTSGRDLDISALSYEILRNQGPQQWPFTEKNGSATGQRRLYEDGKFAHADGRARFILTPYKPPAETVDARYPLHLNTGRLRDQWHGMSRTGNVAALFNHAPEPALQMHAQDMRRLGLRDGDLAHVSSRRGSIILPVVSSADMAAGQGFVAMHWGEESVSGRAPGGAARHGVNALSLPVFDPVSRQPELKHSAIKVLKAELPWRMTVFAWVEQGVALRLQLALRSIMREFSYASCTLFGRDKTGILFRAADIQAAGKDLQEHVQQLFGIVGTRLLRYEDNRRGTERLIKMADDQLQAVSLVGDISAETWLKDYLQQQQSVAKLGRLLLMPGLSAPSSFQSAGKIVCSCENVAAQAIQQAIREAGEGDILAQLQSRLRCGTNCGSCVPELKDMIRKERMRLTVPAIDARTA